MSSKLDILELRGLTSAHAWDYENGFHWFSHPSRMAKMFAHYELYKSIVDLPGHVIELGVYKAASLIRWLTLREIFESDYSRKIFGFDAFGKFPVIDVANSADLRFINQFEGAGGEGLSADECNEILEKKRFENCVLIQGNIFDTIPLFLAEHPELKIALLHLDMDVHEPTAYALDMLFDRVVPGGLIVVDDYNAVAGATRAIDEFLSRKTGGDLAIRKLPYYSVPAFIRKT
jgi:hypothetical protein